MPESPAHDSRSRLPIALWGALVAALVIRAFRLNESLWYDEIFAWMDYVSHGPMTIASTFTNPVNHVLNSLLTWASVEVFAPTLGSEIAMRLPALVASILLVPLMFTLTRSLVPSRPIVAVAAAWLSATLSIPVLEAVESRGYSMMMLSAAASTWAFVRLLDPDLRSSRIRDGIFYMAVAALGVYAHPVTICVPIGHGIISLVVAFRTNNRFALATVIGAGVLSVLLFVPMIDDLVRTKSMYAHSDDAQPTILGIEGLHMLIGLSGSWIHIAAIPGFVLAMLGIVALRSTESGSRARLFIMAGALGVPILIIASMVAQTWIYARFTVFVLPAMILLMAFGVDWLRTRHQALGIAALALAALVNVGMTMQLPPKQPLRDVMEFIEPRDGERILVVGLAHPVMNVYAGDATIEYSYLHGRDFEERLAHVRPNWIIVMYPYHVNDTVIDAIPDALGSHRRFEGWGDWGNCSLDVYGPSGRFNR